MRSPAAAAPAGPCSTPPTRRPSAGSWPASWLFLDIPRVCRAVLDNHHFSARPTLAELAAVDRWARQEVARWTTTKARPGPRRDTAGPPAPVRRTTARRRRPTMPAPTPLAPRWLAQQRPVPAGHAAPSSWLYRLQLGWRPRARCIAMVALGLGFVIFIHELGHFLVAKWCDVHVADLQHRLRPGPARLQLPVGRNHLHARPFPLGGYVKMVGEGAEERRATRTTRARSRTRPVWQRMAIISAGVIMNVILGFACSSSST